MTHPAAAEADKDQRFTRWVMEYGDAILRTCFAYLGNVKDAEDAMQDTFLKAWANMDQFEKRNNANEKTWLMRIAINVCHDIHRTNWFRRVDLSRALEDLPPRYLKVEAQDLALTLDVMRLKEPLKQVILLCYFQEMTIREAAEILGLAPSTVHERLKKAEKQLKIILTGGEEIERQPS